jgi:hypothetical protein
MSAVLVFGSRAQPARRQGGIPVCLTRLPALRAGAWPRSRSAVI